MKRPDLQDVMAATGIIAAGVGAWMVLPLGILLILVGGALVAAALRLRAPRS